MKKDEIVVVSVMGGIGIILALIALSVESIVAKWIWGVLAIAMFGLTIYTIIDAIVKSKRKPMDLADILIKSLEEQAKKPGFKEDFLKGMEAKVEKRNSIFEGQRTEDDDYGYSLTNPICTSGIISSEKYLSRLWTSDGRKIHWLRKGAISLKNCNGVSDVIVDIYSLYINGGLYEEINICPYAHNSNVAPKGLILSSEICVDDFGGNIYKQANESGMTPEQFLIFLQLKNKQERR